jgi:hypothetical protein
MSSFSRIFLGNRKIINDNKIKEKAGK